MALATLGIERLRIREARMRRGNAMERKGMAGFSFAGALVNGKAREGNG